MKEWSTEGVWDYEPNGPALVCATSHLSIFGAIERFVQVGRAFFGFWTLGSTARLVMHECAVVRNSAVAQGRSSAHTANTDKICTRILGGDQRDFGQMDGTNNWDAMRFKVF